MNPHLSSEQLDDVLAGKANPAAVAHAATCVHCSQELAALSGIFGNLRITTAAVAENHRLIASPRNAPRAPRMAWALATIALFASVAVPLAVRRPATVQNHPAATPPVAMSDEALMESVRNDLASSVPESLQPLASTTTNETSTTTTRKD